MKNRRDFLKLSALGAGALVVNGCVAKDESVVAPEQESKSPNSRNPIVISTWNHGLAANEAAWEVLSKGGIALDAVEKGVNVTELDPDNRSVGYGGRPDREGVVTLDACIMDHRSMCGSVAFLTDIKTPISVARKVMEETPHVMLAGEGARQFAIEQGFKVESLLTPESEADWIKWLEESEYKPVINQENHDTIGMLAIDELGNLSGACTTSGWAYKMHGRVGDSPIIGAGLYVDNEVGAACATGMGEAVIRTCGSHLVVELIRQGKSPEEACVEAVERIHKVHKNNLEGLQVGFLALNKKGETGAYSMYKGFNYAEYSEESNQMIDSKYKLEW